MTLTRWDEWFSEENLALDERILAAPHTRCAANAAQAFISMGKRRILEVACGVGRDTFYLEGRGLAVIGVDAAFNGLRVAQRIRSKGDGMAALINADARRLPFKDAAFEGVYCFGLLHEFTGERRERDVSEVIAEITRALCGEGVLVLAVLAGEPEAGLPQVQLFWPADV
jgi:ubiquinone/menaquinone biosynthesis C-methylase UbiE